MEDRAVALEPIGRADLFRQVSNQLVAYIDQNNLQPGDRLPSDRELAAVLQVSRPLVQQALKVLEGLGRITIVHGSGTYVANDGLRVAAAELIRGLPTGAPLAEQLLQARCYIERDVLRQAYERNRSALLADLQRIIELRTEQLASAPQEASLDLHFEAAFARHCANPVLERLQALLYHTWLQLWGDTAGPHVDRHALHSEHVAIYECLVADDVDGALELFDKHMNSLAPRKSARAHRRR